MIKEEKKYQIKVEKAIACALFCTCGTKLFDYVKRGAKKTRYLLLDQFVREHELEVYQYDPQNEDPDRVRLIICHGCHTMLGKPVKRDGKLGFEIRQDHIREVKLFK